MTLRELLELLSYSQIANKVTKSKGLDKNLVFDDGDGNRFSLSEVLDETDTEIIVQ